MSTDDLSNEQKRELVTPGSRMTFGVPKTTPLDNQPAKSKAGAVKNSKVSVQKHFT